MPHVIEEAASGRAKCRGCSRPIAKGELRLGERLPNPFADGEMSLWFHPRCAAYKRPQPLLEVLESRTDMPDREGLVRAAEASLAHRRLPRIDGAERSPTGRAKCRHCRKPIPRDAWRIRLVFYEEGRFEPGGFLHLECRGDYFETADVADRLRAFSPDLDATDLDDLSLALGSSGAP